MTEVVELEIPALPEFVGIARMAVAALAGVRPGLEYDRVDDLRIVVSEACTSAIEAFGNSSAESPARVRLRCQDGPQRLEVSIEGPAGAFDAVASEDEGSDSGFRISLIRALVDQADVQSTPSGSELRLVVHRQVSPQTIGQG